MRPLTARDGTAPLDEILITEELTRRPSRPPDREAETQALRALARRMAAGPDMLLRALVETAVNHCQAGTAGVSLLEASPCGGVFRWAAVAGACRFAEGFCVPGDFSPCGVTLEKGSPQLFERPARRFSYFAETEPAIVEGLVVPLAEADGVPLGTIWVVSHEEGRRFDAEDARLLTTLADFTSAALRMSLAVTVSVRSSREAEEWRSRYEAAVRASGQVLYDSDSRSGEVVFGGECEQILGYTCEELRGHVSRWLDLIHRDDVPIFTRAYDRAHAGASFVPVESRVRRKDGDYVTLRDLGEAVPDEGGRPARIIGFLKDVTEQKASETALRESDLQFRMLAEAVPQMVWITRPDGWHEFYNARWYEYTGMTREESAGHGWNLPLHPKDRQRSIERWKVACETGEPYEIEYRFRRHEGVYRWFLGRALPVKNEHGDVVRWFGTCTDIEDAKRTEEALRQSEARHIDAEAALRSSQERLMAALSASDTGTFRWSPETGEFLEFDENLGRLFGFTPRSRSRLPKISSVSYTLTTGRRLWRRWIAPAAEPTSKWSSASSCRTGVCGGCMTAAK